MDGAPDMANKAQMRRDRERGERFQFYLGDTKAICRFADSGANIDP